MGPQLRSGSGHVQSIKEGYTAPGSDSMTSSGASST